MCNIIIELGYIWEVLSSIGTIGAAIVALWLGLRKPKKKLDIILVWDFVTKSNPTVYLCNPTIYTLAVESIELIYNKKSLSILELTNKASGSYTGIIKPNGSQCFTFDNVDLSCISIFDYTTDNLEHKLEIIVKDVSNNKYIETMNVTEGKIKRQKAGKAILNS